jgi:hypothetical protein
MRSSTLETITEHDSATNSVFALPEFIAEHFAAKNSKILFQGSDEIQGGGETEEIWAKDLLEKIKEVAQSYYEGDDVQSGFLNNVLQAMLNPYYAQLEEADADDEDEIQRINHNIRDVKLTLNRALKAYNKSEAGKENPFYSRVVALANAPGSVAAARARVEDIANKDFERQLQEADQAYYESYKYAQEKNAVVAEIWYKKFNTLMQVNSQEDYQNYLNSLSVDSTADTSLIEAEWKRVTRNRLSFRVRLQAAEAEGENKYQAMKNILGSMYAQSVKENCDKCYVVVDYTADILRKVKDKWKKYFNTVLCAVFGIIVGLSEGIVAGFAMFTLMGPASIAVGVAVAVAGVIANVPTMFYEGKDTFKSLLHNRLFGEAGNMLSKGKKNAAIALMVSVVGYALGLAFLTVVSLTGIGLPIAAAVGVACVAFVSTFFVFQNLVTKMAKSGELDKLKGFFNFKKMWRELGEQNPAMNTAAKVAVFIFWTIICKKILAVLLKLIVIFAFGKAFFDSANGFGADFSMSAGASSALGWIGVVLSSPFSLVFVQAKLHAIWQKFVVMMKDIFTVENSDGKRVVTGKSFGNGIATLLNAMTSGIVKVAYLSVMLVFVLGASVIGSFVKAVHKIRCATDKAYAEKSKMAKINHHEERATCRKAVNSSTGKTVGNLLKVSCLANASGQGALIGEPVKAVIPGSTPAANVGNLIMQITALTLGGMCSFILNAEAAEDVVKAVASDGRAEEPEEKPAATATLDEKCQKQWSTLGKEMRRQWVAMGSLITQTHQTEHFAKAFDKIDGVDESASMAAA